MLLCYGAIKIDISCRDMKRFTIGRFTIETTERICLYIPMRNILYENIRDAYLRLSVPDGKLHAMDEGRYIK